VREQLWELAGALPWVSGWVRQAELYRWSAMLSLLLQNRVNLLSALEQSSQTLRGSWIRQRGRQMSDAVRQGKSLGDVVAGQQLLDAPSLSLIRVGEKSGTLGRTLETLSQRFRQASQRRVQRFLVLLEPLTILFISVFLGGVMISVILAVTSLTNTI
jgi:general secretion pathway protein F